MNALRCRAPFGEKVPAGFAVCWNCGRPHPDLAGAEAPDGHYPTEEEER